MSKALPFFARSSALISGCHSHPSLDTSTGHVTPPWATHSRAQSNLLCSSKTVFALICRGCGGGTTVQRFYMESNKSTLTSCGDHETRTPQPLGRVGFTHSLLDTITAAAGLPKVPTGVSAVKTRPCNSEVIMLCPWTSFLLLVILTNPAKMRLFTFKSSLKTIPWPFLHNCHNASGFSSKHKLLTRNSILSISTGRNGPE